MFFKTHISLKDALKACRVARIESLFESDYLIELKQGIRSEKHLAGFRGKVYYEPRPAVNRPTLSDAGKNDNRQESQKSTCKIV